jgi:hypothetical protein
MLPVSVFTWQKHSLSDQVLYSWIEETLLSLEIIPSVLEATGSSTVFPCDCWVGLWKEYPLSVSVFKWEKYSLYEKKAYSVELKKHIYVLEQYLYVWSSSDMPMFSLWELNYHVTEILPISQHFQVGETFTLGKRVLFSWIWEALLYPGRTDFMWETILS